MEQVRNCLEIILLPKKIHSKISTNYVTLIIGILFVGFYDVLFPPTYVLANILTGDSANTFVNMVFAVFFSVLIGILDVVCFAYPLGDFINLMAKRNELAVRPGIHIIMMKAYILTHVVMVPINIVSYYFLTNEALNQNMVIVKIAVAIYYIYYNIQPYWISGIVLKTINTKIKFVVILRIATFFIIFVWGQLTAMAITYLDVQIFKLFQWIQTFFI